MTPTVACLARETVRTRGSGLSCECRSRQQSVPTPYADTPVVEKQNAAPVGADSSDSPAGDAMIGRKIVKSVGETVCSGVVRDFFPATGNQEESKWKVEWDDGDDVMAVVNRAELDKYLRMQMTKEAVFGPSVRVCVVLCAPFCGLPVLLP